MEVVEGELKGLEGKVISCSDDGITILPRHDDLKVSHKCGTTEPLLSGQNETNGWL